MDTKKILVAISSLALFAAPFVSSAALGANLKAAANVSGSSMQVSAGANFCTNLSIYNTNISAKITTAENNLATLQQSIMSNAKNRQATRATALANIRAQADSNRQAMYVKLNAEATTTVESQAVATFQTTIEADVAARRLAVDTAIAAYWSGVFNVIQTRQAAVQTAEQNYTAALQAALTTASSSCGGGTAAATVRAVFAASVKAATTAFATDRKTVDKSGPQIKVLAQARNTSVATAFATFKTQAAAAGVTLKAAFGV